MSKDCLRSRARSVRCDRCGREADPLHLPLRRPGRLYGDCCQEGGMPRVITPAERFREGGTDARP